MKPVLGVSRDVVLTAGHKLGHVEINSALQGVLECVKALILRATHLIVCCEGYS